MESSRPKPVSDRKRRSGRVLLDLAGLALVFLLVAWWRLVADNPKIKIPQVVLPNPNAYDFYIAAGKSIVNSSQVDAALVTNPVAAMPLSQQEALLKQNVSALQSLHQGFAYEYRHPRILSIVTPFPPYTTLRHLARLSALQYQVQAAQGDWGGAVDSALDAIRLGEDVPRGGGLIAHSVGIACEQIGQKPLWSSIEHLHAAQSREAIHRLEEVVDRHFPYADTIQDEKWTGVGTLKFLFQHVTVQSALRDADRFAGEKSSFSERYSIAFYLLYGKKRVLQNYTEFMDAVSEGVRKPYALKMLTPPMPTDPINAYLLPLFSNGRTLEASTRAQNGILLIAPALHAFQLEQGHYPASLTELTPAYLRKLPDDPFAVQGTFMYRIHGKSYTLYSVGPDGKDDGSKPIDDPQNAVPSNPQARFRVQAASVGDIVAGINMP